MTLRSMHQETAHFKQIILEEALPRLVHWERVAYRLVWGSGLGSAYFRCRPRLHRARWFHGRERDGGGPRQHGGIA
jgi:hypothetical protein